MTEHEKLRRKLESQYGLKPRPRTELLTDEMRRALDEVFPLDYSKAIATCESALDGMVEAFSLPDGMVNSETSNQLELEAISEYDRLVPKHQYQENIKSPLLNDVDRPATEEDL